MLFCLGQNSVITSRHKKTSVHVLTLDGTRTQIQFTPIFIDGTTPWQNPRVSFELVGDMAKTAQLTESHTEQLRKLHNSPTLH